MALMQASRRGLAHAKRSEYDLRLPWLRSRYVGFRLPSRAKRERTQRPPDTRHISAVLGGTGGFSTQVVSLTAARRVHVRPFVRGLS
jgi:hypothetical protein